MEYRHFDEIKQGLQQLAAKHQDRAVSEMLQTSPEINGTGSESERLSTAIRNLSSRLRSQQRDTHDRRDSTSTAGSDNITVRSKSIPDKMESSERARSECSLAADLQRIDAVLAARCDAEWISQNNYFDGQEDNEGNIAKPWHGIALARTNVAVQEIVAIIEDVEQQHQATDAVAHRVTADMKKNLEGLFLMFQQQRDYICDVIDTPDDSTVPTPMPEVVGKKSPPSLHPERSPRTEASFLPQENDNVVPQETCSNEFLLPDNGTNNSSTEQHESVFECKPQPSAEQQLSLKEEAYGDGTPKGLRHDSPSPRLSTAFDSLPSALPDGKTSNKVTDTIAKLNRRSGSGKLATVDLTCIDGEKTGDNVDVSVVRDADGWNVVTTDGAVTAISARENYSFDCNTDSSSPTSPWSP